MPLDALIAVARKRGDRIAAFNPDFTAYCPVNRISYPIVTTRGHICCHFDPRLLEYYSDPDALAQHSYLDCWINSLGEEIESDAAGVESGCCADFGIWYDALDLPNDVRPLVHPLDEQAAKFADLLAEISGLQPQEDL